MNKVFSTIRSPHRKLKSEKIHRQGEVRIVFTPAQSKEGRYYPRPLIGVRKFTSEETRLELEGLLVR